MKKSNVTCSVCGKEYYLCIACDRHKVDWKPWKVIVDNENCYNIYNIVSKYIANNIYKEEARELLKTTDLSGLNNFKNLMKNKIEEILREDENVTFVEETVIENTIVDTVESAEEKNVKKHYKKKDY